MATAKTKKPKTVKKVSKPRAVRKKTPIETDGAFFLKIVLFLIVSSFWLRIEYADGTLLPLPLGAVIAVFYALHDHFQIDRKIELALILVAMFISFWLPVGIYVNL